MHSSFRMALNSSGRAQTRAPAAPADAYRGGCKARAMRAGVAAGMGLGFRAGWARPQGGLGRRAWHVRGVGLGPPPRAPGTAAAHLHPGLAAVAVGEGVAALVALAGIPIAALVCKGGRGHHARARRARVGGGPGGAAAPALHLRRVARRLRWRCRAEGLSTGAESRQGACGAAAHCLGAPACGSRGGRPSARAGSRRCSGRISLCPPWSADTGCTGCAPRALGAPSTAAGAGRAGRVRGQARVQASAATHQLLETAWR